MTIDFNKPTLIAVPGVRIPASDHPLALVITLTPARAEELLRDMRHVTKLANHSSRIFKFCPFESQAAIMATADLPYQPQPEDFVVLPPDFRITESVPTHYVQADIFPWSVCWTACDQTESFIVSATEISAPLLQLIAKGEIIQPGTSKHTLTTRFTGTAVFLNLSKYREPLR